MADNYMNRIFLTLENLDLIPKQISDILLKNDELFKLLYYNADPLNVSNPNLTFKQKIDLIFKRIEQANARVFFVPFSDNVEDEEHCEIRIYVDMVSPVEDNLAEVIFRIDILCHNNLMQIKEGNRALLMMMGIVKSLNGYTETNSVSQLQLPLNRSLNKVYWNKNFQGYTIPIKGRISNKGRDCDV